MMRIAAVLLLLGFGGCAGGQRRHLRPGDSADRQVAMALYALGAPIGFAGCVAGFATLNPIAVGICIGGWAVGSGGVMYLGLDDKLRGDSYCRANPTQRGCGR